MRFSKKVVTALESIGSISRNEINLIKNVFYDRNSKTYRFNTGGGGNSASRELSKEEKATLIQLIIKVMMLLYAKIFAGVGAAVLKEK